MSPGSVLDTIITTQASYQTTKYWSSFHVEFYELYWSIFITNPCSTTDPDLDVIGCGGRQLYIEPWW